MTKEQCSNCGQILTDEHATSSYGIPVFIVRSTYRQAGHDRYHRGDILAAGSVVLTLSVPAVTREEKAFVDHARKAGWVIE